MGTYIPDYRLHVFEIAYLTDEQVASFQSDFRYVAEYFVQSRLEREGKPARYKYSLEHIRHVNEFMELMNALTGGRKFDGIDDIIKERGEQTMVTIIDRREARGKAEGYRDRLLNQIRKKIAKSKTFDQIVDECESTPEEIRPCYDQVIKELEKVQAEE